MGGGGCCFVCVCWPYGAHRYLESKLLLLSISCDSPEDMEALPQAWKRILERYEEDTVQGSSSPGRPKGCFISPGG